MLVVQSSWSTPIQHPVGLELKLCPTMELKLPCFTVDMRVSSTKDIVGLQCKFHGSALYSKWCGALNTNCCLPNTLPMEIKKTLPIVTTCYRHQKQQVTCIIEKVLRVFCKFCSWALGLNFADVSSPKWICRSFKIATAWRWLSFQQNDLFSIAQISV